MNYEQTSNTSDAVLFDQIVSTIPGGVAIDTDNAKTRFTDGIIPAGTLIIKTEGAKVAKVLASSGAVPGASDVIGLTPYSVALKRNTLLPVVVAGTARSEALPAREKSVVANLKTALPRITFY